MNNQFMKKCSECGKMGAAYQTTNEQGKTAHLCHDCKKAMADKATDKQPEAASN